MVNPKPVNDSYPHQSLTRRRFLRLGGTSTAALLLAGCGIESMSLSSDTAVRAPVQSFQNNAFVPDLELALVARPETAAILPGAETQIYRYASVVLQGDADAVETLNGYPGPIIRVNRGHKIRIHFRNELAEESIIHWHGLVIPEAMDGHPRFAIAPGETFVYEFEVENRAGTYWFHPHPHGLTGSQVYNGLAGLFIVSDEEEAALDLPAGAYDIPLVIQDRLFDNDNQFVYTAASDGANGGMMGRGRMGGMMGGGMDSMMAQMMGQRGDRILVNGAPDAVLDVATQAYRLRLLNGSNSRIYKLAWSDDTPLTVIGSDGGLLAAPQQKPYVTLAPGERVELWADFSGYPVGTELQLRSLAFSAFEMGGMMMDMGQDALPSGAPFPVLDVRVASAAQEMQTLPSRLSTIAPLEPDAAFNVANPYVVALFMQNMQWTLNGRTFEMQEVAQEERMPLGELALWRFENQPGRGMMADFMSHPMHLHGVQFQVVERAVDPDYRTGWETLADGFVDDGWKDTVLVMPGEAVTVLMRFTQPGLFVYHCHVLEHEDMGMMRNFEVL